MAKQSFETDAQGAGGSRPAGEAPAAPAVAPAQPAPAAATAETPKPPKPRRKIGRLLLVVLLAAAAGFGGLEARDWWTHGRFLVETDDAYVAADITTVAAKVAGHIEHIDVAPNQTVRAGDAILHLDPGDFELAVAAARDRIASQDAALARIGRQVTAAEAAVRQAEAEVSAATADVDRAEAEFRRQARLVATKVAATAQLDDARAGRDRAAASLEAARAGLSAAEANVEVLRAQSVEADRAKAELQTALDKAQRDLSFTVVRAPVDGVVGNRAVEEGAYVQPGQRLAALVPLSALHVDANFKETQVSELKPGQTVEVTVDALPGKVLEGRVESFAPATGSVFSLLPAENATGNFTKVVQRLPVRISLPADAAADGLIRPGMSAIVGVDLRTGESERKTAGVE